MRSKHGAAANALYNSRKWRKARAEYLRANNKCLACGNAGILRMATVVDHIKPHNGDVLLFWDVSNWQPLCKSCHDTKTATQNGGFGNKRFSSTPMPKWLKASRPELTIVTGPPASGKTTHVANHAGPQDVIIDLDAIKAKLLQSDEYEANTSALLDAALSKRNEMLAGLAHSEAPKAWFIVCAPEAEQRRIWALVLRPMHVLVVRTSLGVCRERIKNDTARAHVAGEQLRAATMWWQRYSPRPDDVVVSGTPRRAEGEQ